MTDYPVRIRPEIANLPAYRQGKHASGEAFKLSSNENPFDPLPGVVEATRRAESFNRYPPAGSPRLTERLAERFGVPAGDVHVAAGSVSILYQLVSATTGPGDELLFPWRSFEAYPGLAAVAGSTAVTIPLDEHARHDFRAMADAVTDRTRIILVCSPNNPTGPAVHRDEFAAFVDSVPNDVLIVLDEAYAEFVTDPDAVRGEEIVHEGRDNVVVLRTFSKAYGLAGLRVGYAIGHAAILGAARTAGIPLSVTAVAEEAALASLDHDAELQERVAVIAARRDELAGRLRDAGWKVPDAQGNFVWLPAGADTDRLAVAFAEEDLIARPFSGDGIRISVGEEASVDRVVEVAARERRAEHIAD